MVTPATDIRAELLKAIEKYLVREGLRPALPPAKRHQHDVPAPRFWAVALVVVALIVSLVKSALTGVSTIWAVLPMVAVLIIFWLLHSGFRLLSRSLNRANFVVSASLFGYLFIFTTAVATGAAVWSLLGNYLYGLLNVALVGVCYRLLQPDLGLLQQFASLTDAWRTFLSYLKKMFRIMGVILPMMVVFLLLTIFSGELWQAVSVLPFEKLAMVFLLILGVGVLVAVSSIQGLTTWVAEQERKVAPPAFIERAIAHPPILLVGELLSGKQRWLQELVAQDVEAAYAEAEGLTQACLRRHIRIRLVASALLLSVLFYTYLWGLFSLLFPAEVIKNYQTDKLVAIEPNAVWAMHKVLIFLVTFIVSYYIVQAFREDQLKRELFGDLTGRLEKWKELLVLYKICQTPGYKYLVSVEHPAIHTAELEIVVPSGTTREEARELCSLAAEGLESPASAVLVTAHEYQEGVVYDWGMPGRRWHLLRLPDGVTFTEQNSSANDVRYRDEILLEFQTRRRNIPLDWYGQRVLDRQVAFRMLNLGADLASYHPYSWGSEEGACQWLFLRQVQPPPHSPAYEDLARKALGVIREVFGEVEKPMPALVCISIYSTHAPSRLAHLIWRRDRPEALALRLNESRPRNA
jgi:hypothetical protein